MFQVGYLPGVVSSGNASWRKFFGGTEQVRAIQPTSLLEDSSSSLSLPISLHQNTPSNTISARDRASKNKLYMITPDTHVEH